MAYFASAEEVYATLGRLLEDAASSGGVGTEGAQTNASVRLALSEPAATITLVFSEAQASVVTFGRSSFEATLTLQMSADTAHELFLGKATFVEVVGDGRLTERGVSGSFAPAWAQMEFALPARYAQILVAAGRSDLALGS